MAKRQPNLLEDCFDALQRLPWWAGLIAAFVFRVMANGFSGAAAGGGSAAASLRPLYGLVFNGFALLSLFAALASALRSLSRRKLFDNQRDIDSIRNLTWQAFEQLVGEAYRRQGYDIEETGGGGADGGIDLVLRGHRETVLVQCKRWRNRQVGVDKVRELLGVVTANRADRGILVTSGRYSDSARRFAADKALTLVDGPELVRLVQNIQAGHTLSPVKDEANHEEPATECPRCGSAMVLRTARRGAHAGSRFYGCSRYPHCKAIRPADESG
jgi:restriction system protein